MKTRNLITLSSRQIWPQILTLLDFAPERAFLLHTSATSESREPAERLRDFCRQTHLLPDASALVLRSVPHDRFQGIVDSIADLAAENDLDEGNTVMNLTGGNKLMAMAAAEWCRLAGVPSCYLERDGRVFPFRSIGGDLLPEPDYRLDEHLARSLDPLLLLRCQLGEADIVDPGQRLTLNPRGADVKIENLGQLFHDGFDFTKYLDADRPEAKDHHGFKLEYATAFALLKLGVPVVQRSLRLQSRVIGDRLENKDEGELDLVFNWAGKLWVVDCKDVRDPARRVDALRTELLRHLKPTSRMEQELQRIEEMLRARELKPLKEDLQVIKEVGGLLGRAICVRSTPLPPEAQYFANSRNIDVVLKNELMDGLRAQLFPHQPLSLAELKRLATRTPKP